MIPSTMARCNTGWRSMGCPSIGQNVFQGAKYRATQRPHTVLPHDSRYGALGCGGSWNFSVHSAHLNCTGVVNKRKQLITGDMTRRGRSTERACQHTIVLTLWSCQFGALSKLQTLEKTREFTTCDNCYREMHGGGKDAAKAEAGRCKQRAGNTTLR